MVYISAKNIQNSNVRCVVLYFTKLLLYHVGYIFSKYELMFDAAQEPYGKVK